jgi:hypothetical protein
MSSPRKIAQRVLSDQPVFGRWTGKRIAVQVGVSPATVSRVLRRLGLNKLSASEPAEPVRRYEPEHPGELIHLDIKKLGRIGSTRVRTRRRPRTC